MPFEGLRGRGEGSSFSEDASNESDIRAIMHALDGVCCSEIVRN